MKGREILGIVLPNIPTNTLKSWVYASPPIPFSAWCYWMNEMNNARIPLKQFNDQSWILSGSAKFKQLGFLA